MDCILQICIYKGFNYQMWCIYLHAICIMQLPCLSCRRYLGVFTVKILDTFGIFKCSCCFYAGKVLPFSRAHNAAYLGKSATINVFSKAMADFSKMLSHAFTMD